MNSLFRDLRHACRSLLRMPLLASVVIGSLAVGIGVNTTVFSWIQGLVMAPLPGVHDGASFRSLEARTESGTLPGMSWLEYQDLSTSLRSYQALIASRMVPLNVGDPGQIERAYGVLASANYFSALGLEPALGRFFRAEEVSRAGGEPVAVISYDFWQTRFAGDPAALNRTLRINDRPITIVGVAPEGFQGTVTMLTFDIWVPATLAPVLFRASTELTDRASRGYSVMGRLTGGATMEGALRELTTEMERLAQLYPLTNAGVSGEVRAFTDAPRGPQGFLVRALTLLQAIMLLLLLAVCGNTANLMLARASTRRREVGVRLALGSGPWRVARLLMLENLVLGLVGAGLGAGLAVWGTQALRAVPMIAAFPIRFETSIDLTGLAFAILLGVGCSVVFGAAPALQLVRINPQDVLRGGSSTAARGGLKNLLMGVEVGLATVILVAAGLFFQSFRDARQTDPGFRREGVLLAAYDLSGGVTDTATVRGFTEGLLGKLRSLPGVEGAAIAWSVPLDIHGLGSREFSLEGRARTDTSSDEALFNLVTPGYFAVMGVPIISGKDFSELADRSAGPEAVVNDAFVRKYLPDAEPLGRRLRMRDRDYTIAGVVKTTVADAFGEPPTPVIYLSYRDRLQSGGEMHVRTRTGDERALTPEIRRVVRELDPMLPIYDVRTLSEHVDRNLFIQRIPAQMFLGLGPLILALASIGIYSVVAYAVAQRTSEIGIRLALGATSPRIVSQMMMESMQTIVLGAIGGSLIAFAIGRRLTTSGSIPLVILVGVPLLMLVVAAVACWVPARRAARIDALAALRWE